MHVPVSPEISAIVDDATELSIRRGQPYVGVEHLLDTLLTQSDALPQKFVDAHFGTLQSAIHEMLRERWQGNTGGFSTEVFFTPRCAAVTARAARLAKRHGASQPAAGHLLLAILHDHHSGPSRAMDRIGSARARMTRDLKKALTGMAETTTEAPTPTASDAAAAKPERIDTPEAPEGETKRKRKRSPIESLTRDMTKAAREGQFESVIGRDREVRSVLEVLARKTKNNVMLVGDAGVGKTRIVEGLAASMADGGIEGLFDDFRLLELNVGALTAGTQYRGSFEEKLLGLIEELKKDEKTILFIDEVHLIMGAGTAEGGSVDMANMLKPALARGEIRCIGATTLQEYRKFIERDPAVERRFQLVRVEPLSSSATYSVLERLKPALEDHHQVYIGRKAMRAAVELSRRYMPNRHLPDKAIDVIDQAAASYRLTVLAYKRHPERFEGKPPIARKVTPHDVRKVISQITAVPIEEITADERLRLGDLERRIKRRIIGQDLAVDRAVAAVKKSRAGLAAPNRPDAVMLFLGPTGVGKTELAKALASHMFGSADHLVTFDMSEFVEEHSVSKLLGAPPGYKGSDEPGRLIAAVKDTPFCVLLFDEIEKAHPRIFDIFLPMLDEGRLKDARGRVVDFRHSIIIFTSNIAADFMSSATDSEECDVLLEELRRHFRPEFINRVDEIVPFHPLLFEDVRSILKVYLAQVRKRLRERGLDLQVYQGAYEYLAEKGYDPRFGARELQRTVERRVMNPISAAVIEERYVKGDTIKVLVEDEALVFRKSEPDNVAEPS